MSGTTQVWATVLLGLACLWLLRGGWRALRGTTLRAAWWWALAAVVAIAAAELVVFAGLGEETHAETLRFAAAVLLFCPTIALLGGKRPQNSAWQFIVLTLWGILALPAFEITIRGRGEALLIDPVRSWFLVVLIGVSAVNHLPTRFRIAAVQSAAAQALLLWPQLPWSGMAAWRPPVWLAMLVLVGAAWSARRAAARMPNATPSAHDVVELRSWSYVWLDFRDWFGTVWSVRMMERLNATAIAHEWPMALGWDGFVWQGDNGADMRLAQEQRASAVEALRALLLRFVSREWIEERLKVAGA